MNTTMLMQTQNNLQKEMATQYDKKVEIFFSIIMPTYNRGKLIGKAISSVLEQDYPHFELIIVNDGGTDNTEEIVKGFNDPRIKYYWKENEQKGIAKNFGFSKAVGHYVSSFDDDDIMYSNHLTAALELIKQHNNPAAVYVHYEVLNEEYKVIEKAPDLNGNIGKLLIYKNPLSNNGVFLRKDICTQFQYLPNPELKLSADWLLWLQLTQHHTIHYSNIVTHGVLVHTQRGSASAKANVYIRNKELFLQSLKQDETFLKKNKKGLRYITAYYDTYIALFLSLQGNKVKTLQYLLNGVLQNPKELFRRRTLAIIKYLAIRW